MTTRRRLLQASAALLATPLAARAQQRTFEPKNGEWRTFDVTTRVDLQSVQGAARLWIPLPSLETAWQQSVDDRYTTNGRARIAADQRYGARMLAVEFDPAVTQPYAEVTSRIRTRDRAAAAGPLREDAATLAFWTAPTTLIPTDGIVRSTALKATEGARADGDKVRRIYDWVVANAYREPKVRGCGEGDIRTMLETGNLGGKCADLNALFVGLCRSVGVPARDVYGLRVAPSAFGYRELGANPASLKGAQHCRAEVFLQSRGWVAMDPADVAKVMRQETPEWIRSASHPLVAPVNRGLYGGWEGNWMAYNTAHDLALPGSRGPKLGFLMYPIAEDAQGRLDPYAPDDFRYQITSKEVKA